MGLCEHFVHNARYAKCLHRPIVNINQQYTNGEIHFINNYSCLRKTCYQKDTIGSTNYRKHRYLPKTRYKVPKTRMYVPKTRLCWYFMLIHLHSHINNYQTTYFQGTILLNMIDFNGGAGVRRHIAVP